MERLTRVLDTGKVVPTHRVGEALKRLAEYEDTGLMPDEIIDLKDVQALVVGEICTAAIKNVLTEYLSDELANALTGEIALELAKAAKEIQTEDKEQPEA